jgi:hypothetical protein
VRYDYVVVHRDAEDFALVAEDADDEKPMAVNFYPLADYPALRRQRLGHRRPHDRDVPVGVDVCLRQHPAILDPPREDLVELLRLRGADGEEGRLLIAVRRPADDLGIEVGDGHGRATPHYRRRVRFLEVLARFLAAGAELDGLIFLDEKRVGAQKTHLIGEGLVQTVDDADHRDDRRDADDDAQDRQERAHLVRPKRRERERRRLAVLVIITAQIVPEGLHTATRIATPRWARGGPRAARDTGRRRRPLRLRI